MSSITYIKIGDETCFLKKLAVLQSEIFFSNPKNKRTKIRFFPKIYMSVFRIRRRFKCY